MKTQELIKKLQYKIIGDIYRRWDKTVQIGASYGRPKYSFQEAQRIYYKEALKGLIPLKGFKKRLNYHGASWNDLISGDLIKIFKKKYKHFPFIKKGK